MFVPALREQHLESLLLIRFIGITGIAGRQRLQVRVGVVVCRGRHILLVLVPDPPIEHVHPTRPGPHGFECIPLYVLGVLAKAEQSAQTRLALAAIIRQLGLVEGLLGWLGHERNLVEITHREPPSLGTAGETANDGPPAGTDNGAIVGCMETVFAGERRVREPLPR